LLNRLFIELGFDNSRGDSDMTLRRDGRDAITGPCLTSHNAWKKRVNPQPSSFVGMVTNARRDPSPVIPAEHPMAQRKHEPGPPMDLAIMRRQGVRSLIAYCLNDACRHQAFIEVWSHPPETTVAYFKNRVVCAKCGARRNKIDVMPNWKEAPGTIDHWSGCEAMPGGE
jgi:hypothetical protein